MFSFFKTLCWRFYSTKH
ncbi:hypothetical protein Zm00014a_031544 [Zea mays]|uniref:Uncharacterized protein n=1 Tax=Zea mays TaxID=4577 RepID=A0A3L6FGA5_MAIZE|nr:hypothetical protein Zm00014a_031544 [Zea mays]